MKQYLVKITDEALADMERLYHYIACDLQSPEYALAQYNRIAEKIMKLSVFPKRYQLVKGNTAGSKEIRRMPVDNYLIFYLIKNEEVYVINVLYHAVNHRNHRNRI